ncbi:TIGR04283 family arsenosugar biosynthesis glycosyltransferase [bacterium]|nr:TIGR04283 family arsenosugar biosynthesis glycosyltransferase [bacterium]
MKISIVVPVLNEANVIGSCLAKLLEWEDDIEIIVADGGSRDETVPIAKQMAAGSRKRLQVLENLKPGRAFQMNAGADAATGDVLLFLHADCTLHQGSLNAICEHLKDETIIGGGFYKKYSVENFSLRIYRIAMNVIRTRWMKNLVGTNAIFVRKQAFVQLGKFNEVSLLEDVMLSDRMKKAGRLIFLKPHVVSSSRRYYEAGILRRIWIAYKIMYLYRIKHRSPDELKSIYTQMTR